MKDFFRRKKHGAGSCPVSALRPPEAPPEGLVMTPPCGLSPEEAERRALGGQANRPTSEPGKSVLKIIADNLFTLFNLLNFALAFCLALVGSWRNMLFLGVVFSNTLIGAVQELRARAMIKKLRLLEVRPVRTIRGGSEVFCAPDELVQGDLIILSRGDQIPADAVIADGACAADESLLTGESEPVQRSAGELLLSGSFLTEGRVTAQLTAVGDSSYASRLTREAKRVSSPRSELMTELSKLVSLVSKLLVPIGVIMFAEQYFLFKTPAGEAVPKAVAAMIGMIPEGLILLTSVALMAGVVKLGRRRTLVQELFGIETLARADMLCTDKTGTLTTGEMRFGGFVPIEADEAELERALRDFVSAFEADSGTLRALASAFEGSGEKALCTIPFSSARKRSAASFGFGTLILGAPSFVTDKPVPEAAEYSEKGFRVLLIAGSDSMIENGEFPEVTRLLGLVLLRETPRPSARATLDWFKNEGVQVRIMSGDDPRTAAAVARELGLDGAENAVDCSKLSDDELAKAAETGVVFGRLTPDRKRMLVEALKDRGHNVAMTGDGVNDIPSLKAADCSIAMGGGSEATEHSSQLVLLDNDFNSLPAVVAEGRRVIGNITRTASLFLQKTLYSFGLSAINILIALFLPLKYPFEPIHLTLVSAVTVGIPSFFLALEPSSERAKGHFLNRIILNALPGAAGVFLCALAAMIAEYCGVKAHAASTMAVVSAGTIGLANLVLTCMPFSRLRIAVCAAMCAVFALALAFLPGVFALHFNEMTRGNWLMLFVMTACGLGVLIAGKLAVKPLLEKLDRR